MTVSKTTHVFDLVSKQISTADITGAPPDAIIVSALYPVTYAENIQLSSTVDRSWLVTFFPNDYLSLGASLVSGSLDVTIAYQTYPYRENTNEHEQLSLTANITAGSLDVVAAYQIYPYRENTNEHEQLSLTANITAGTLEVVAAYLTAIYRENANEHEMLSLSGSIVSGSLESV